MNKRLVNITEIQTPYGKADIFQINRKSVRVQSHIGKVCFKMEKREVLLLNKGLKFS